MSLSLFYLKDRVQCILIAAPVFPQIDRIQSISCFHLSFDIPLNDVAYGEHRVDFDEENLCSIFHNYREVFSVMKLLLKIL